MAILTKTLEADLIERLGEVPLNLVAAISTLTAAQRDAFVWAWIDADDAQRQRPADQCLLLEDDRTAFTIFQTKMNLSGALS